MLLCISFMFLCAVTISPVAGHGAMVMPYSWFDTKTEIWTPSGYIKDFVGMRSGLQCAAGCGLPREKLCQDPQCDGFRAHPGCACFWYKNYTFVEKPTLFNIKLRTYAKSEHQEKLLHHPWRAPGFAPIDSPCGVDGGNIKGCVGGKCNHDKGGFASGRKAEAIEFGYNFVVTNWTRGSIVEAAWGITANHGGGYSYRLCKLPKEGINGLTEECFQHTPLEFEGNVQWIQYGIDNSTRFEIPAVRVSKGTFPDGSQWTKNPIPACIGNLGGFYDKTGDCPNGIQFPPPNPFLFGFGVNAFGTGRHFQFSIIDKLRVPKDLEAGAYVLSFRWDTEQTPQVWNTCASIELH